MTISVFLFMLYSLVDVVASLKEAPILPVSSNFASNSADKILQTKRKEERSQFTLSNSHNQ